MKKKITKLMVTMALALGLASQAAMAWDVILIGGLTTGGLIVGGPAGAAMIGAGAGTSAVLMTIGTLDGLGKEAVLNAVPDALAVYNNTGAATDAFASAKDVIEKNVGHSFASDVDAAFAIIEVSQHLE